MRGTLVEEGRLLRWEAQGGALHEISQHGQVAMQCKIRPWPGNCTPCLLLSGVAGGLPATLPTHGRWLVGPLLAIRSRNPSTPAVHELDISVGSSCRGYQRVCTPHGCAGTLRCGRTAQQYGTEFCLKADTADTLHTVCTEHVPSPAIFHLEYVSPSLTGAVQRIKAGSTSTAQAGVAPAACRCCRPVPACLA